MKKIIIASVLCLLILGCSSFFESEPDPLVESLKEEQKRLAIEGDLLAEELSNYKNALEADKKKTDQFAASLDEEQLIALDKINLSLNNKEITEWSATREIHKLLSPMQQEKFAELLNVSDELEKRFNELERKRRIYLQKNVDFQRRCDSILQYHLIEAAENRRYWQQERQRQEQQKWRDWQSYELHRINEQLNDLWNQQQQYQQGGITIVRPRYVPPY